MALVMYDLDGTLVETVEEIAYAVNMTLSQHNHDELPSSKVRDLIGHGTGWLMKQAWPEKLVTENSSVWHVIMEEFTYHYSEAVGTKSRPYPHVMKTLQVIKNLGIKQAVITNKEQAFANQVLEKSGIRPFFDLVICGDTLPVKKPNADVVRHCLNTLGEDIQTSLFVGDSAIDIATAKNAGIICWVVPYGYNNGEEIHLSNPDKLIADLSSVPSFFNEPQL